MPKGFTIQSDWTTRLARKLQRLGPQYGDIVAAEIAYTALQIERQAAQWAPKDNSFLSNSIKAEQRTGMQWQVSCQVRYAAYMEFGTGTAVEIPKGLEAYAEQFMAPRPVKREVNLPARPFFFPAYRAGIKDLNKRLRDELAKAGKK
jgi:phage gpG-like protein